MYTGGKNSCYQHIINQIPPHRVYCELFLGSGAVMRRKLPATLNIGVDLDGTAVTSVMAMAAPIVRDGVMAGVTAVVAEATPKLTIAANIAANDVARFHFIIANALDFLSSSQFEADTLIYLDPPYLFDTRRSKRPLYSFEFGEKKQHRQLLAIIQSLPCMVILSGYQSELYAHELSAWREASFMAHTRQGMRRETLWMNYEEPTALHDSRYLGKNFRERERIKRKAKRWVNRFTSLPSLERHAVINELRAAGIVNNGDACRRI